MRVDRPSASALTCPYLVRSRADWTRNSRAAVGRARGARFEIAIGSGALDRGSRHGSTVDVYALPLSDDEMRTLAAAEGAGAPVGELAKACRQLLTHGLNLDDVGRVLGLPGKPEVSRLNALNTLSPALLAKAAHLGLGRNHLRWFIGLEARTALKGLAELERLPRKRPTGPAFSVAAVRQWRMSLAPSPAPQTLSPQMQAAIASESERMSTALGAPVELQAFPGSDARRLRIGFASAAALAGALGHLPMGRVEPAAPSDGTPMRWVTIDGITDDELAYLFGSSDA